MEELQTLINTLEQSISSMTIHTQELTNRAETAERGVAELRSQLVSEEERRGEAVKKLEEVRKREVRRLEEERDKFESEVSQCREKVTSLTSSLHKKTRQNAQLDENLYSLEQSLEEQKAQVSRLSREFCVSLVT